MKWLALLLALCACSASVERSIARDDRAELGRHLFYDVRLSKQRNVSCASCHQQAHAFSDTVRSSVGTTGAKTLRNSMSLVNSTYAATLTWFNPLLHDFEAQALVPLVGEAPIELGMSNRDDLLRARMLSEPRYVALFAAAFPGQAEPYTLQNVAAALSSFQRTLVSTRAPYDRFAAGDEHAISEDAKRGLAVFERVGCTNCHGGTFFSSAMAPRDPQPRFENNGLRGDHPPEHYGLFELSGDRADLGKFKPPSLRNIALTAPYMHDGSLQTLDEVLDHYVRGGKASASKSPLIHELTLSAEERRQLHAFFASLTDDALLHDERFADPWSRHQIAGN